MRSDDEPVVRQSKAKRNRTKNNDFRHCDVVADVAVSARRVRLSGRIKTSQRRLKHSEVQGRTRTIFLSPHVKSSCADY